MQGLRVQRPSPRPPFPARAVWLRGLSSAPVCHLAGVGVERGCGAAHCSRQPGGGCAEVDAQARSGQPCHRGLWVGGIEGCGQGVAELGVVVERQRGGGVDGHKGGRAGRQKTCGDKALQRPRGGVGGSVRQRERPGGEALAALQQPAHSAACLPPTSIAPQLAHWLSAAVASPPAACTRPPWMPARTGGSRLGIIAPCTCASEMGAGGGGGPCAMPATVRFMAE